MELTMTIGFLAVMLMIAWLGYQMGRIDQASKDEKRVRRMMSND